MHIPLFKNRLWRGALPLNQSTLLRMAAAAAFGALGGSGHAADAPATGADAQADQTVHMDEFTVSAAQDHGYGSTNSLGASRINLPIQDIPASVIVVNRELIGDLGATEFSDSLRFVSGVINSSSPLNGQLIVRGATVPSALRDGLPEGFNLASGGFDDYAPYDRIEVIKGPAGSLYGSQSVGGQINRVSKQPLGVPTYMLEADTAVTEGHAIARGELDATGPIDAAGKWRYRVAAAIADGDTYYDRRYERQVFNPIFTFNPTPDLKLWFRYEYQYSNIANVASAWVADKRGQIDTFIPRERVSGDPWESFRLWKHYIEAGAEKRLFDNHWTSRLTARFDQENRNHVRYIESAAGSIKFYDKAGNLLGTDQTPSIDFSDPSIFGSITHSRQFAPEVQNQWSRSIYWDNVVNLDTGPISQKMLIYGAITSLAGDDVRYVSALASTPVFDYLHPVYYQTFNPTGLPLTNSVNTRFTGSAYDYGAQDNISFFKNRIIFVLGARRDSTVQDNADYLGKSYSQNVAGANSYKLGAVAKVIEGLSLFYNYSQTYNPQYGTYFRYPDLVVEPKNNQLGAMNEAGVKVDVLDNRIIATASVFRTTQDNNIATEPTINGTPTAILLGDVRITGWEADLAAQPIPAVTVLVALSNDDSKTSTGLYAVAVPEGTCFKTMAKYSFSQGFLSGISFGAGYEYEAKRPGDSADDFMVAAYGVWNAFATYKRGNWSLQANIDNLTDKTYVGTANLALLIYPGQPRTGRLRVSYRF